RDSAPAVPKPKADHRSALGRNARRWFRIDNRRAAARPYLWDFFDSLKLRLPLSRQAQFVIQG
ncbi:MAG: hypothetical protein IKK08_02025, partial [Clostridia bacterium]|nr:hypothetical protein [Clostridia bacterium]